MDIFFQASVTTHSDLLSHYSVYFCTPSEYPAAWRPLVTPIKQFGGQQGKNSPGGDVRDKERSAVRDTEYAHDTQGGLH